MAEVYRWDEIPRERLLGGDLERIGIRSDNALVTFNWFQPGTPVRDMHSHPFDQIAIIVEGEGDMIIEGEAHPMSAGSMMHIAANVRHTFHVKGATPVLNVDVFAPAREDYLHLTDYQKWT